MKQGKLKSMFIFGLVLALLITLVYAVNTNLLSPIDNFQDNDGFLDLRGKCIPSANSTVSHYNITNATLWSNVDGTWKANATLQAPGSVPNATYFFNFTNHINRSKEGEYKWNIECNEQNVSSSIINKAFAGNRTIRVIYADPTVSTTSPIDRIYNLNGHEIDVVCTASPFAEWNITKIDLLTSIKGGLNWTINQTFTPNPLAGVEVVANFTINKIGNNSIADGTDLLFGCSATQIKNLTGKSGSASAIVTSEKSSANRTINVEYPPLVTINKPANNNWSQTQVATLSWTVTSAFTSGTTFSTRIWTNESGTWNPRTGTIIATNDTAFTKTYLFNEKSAIVWSIEAKQQNDAAVFNYSVNRTIRIDATDPVISVATTNRTTNDNTPEINATVTESNVGTLSVFTNFSGTWKINYSNSSIVSGVQANYFNSTAIADGFYIWGIKVNDSSARVTDSLNYSLIIDTVPPAVTVISNASVDTACDQRNITFTTDEGAVSTLTYDTDTDVSDGTAVTNSNLITSHGLVLDFDFNGEITYYFNITVTDLAGNINNSVKQTVFQTPARVCAGWSQYAVYDGLINLSTVQNQSGADLVYFWNATNQQWVFKTAGLTTNDGVNVGYRTKYHVVHLFENTNSTWLRNTTNQGLYNYNVTSVNNFVNVPTDYNFGNLTESFGNTTFNFPSFIGNDSSFGTSGSNSTFGPYNITFFAGYNNTLQDYVSHIFNFTWANETILEPCPNRAFKETCMETFWVASDFNVTWNGTAVRINWTV